MYMYLLLFEDDEESGGALKCWKAVASGEGPGEWNDISLQWTLILLSIIPFGFQIQLRVQNETLRSEITALKRGLMDCENHKGQIEVSDFIQQESFKAFSRFSERSTFCT